MNPQADNPRISIGLPVYQGENYLADAIDSLLGQTFEDIELIISDNGSTDQTEPICRDYLQRDSRVRYFRHDDNRGSAWNHNFVLENARGEYFKWAAHDDLHAATFLERTVAVLNENDDVDWCFTRFQFIDQYGQPLASCDRDAGSILALDGCDRLSNTPHKRFRAAILGSTNCLDIYGLHRRATLLATGRHGRYFGADNVLMAELAMRGRYLELPDVSFFRRIHAAAAGSLRTATEQQNYLAPQSGRKFHFNRLRILNGHLSAIRRSGLPLQEKLACYLVVGRYLLQVSKWPHVVGSFISQTGVGGGYLDKLKPQQELAECGASHCVDESVKDRFDDRLNPARSAAASSQSQSGEREPAPASVNS